MSEQAWQRVLEGGGTDAYQVANGKGGDSDSLPGGESRCGILDRMRDIVVVRGVLFPKTLVAAGPADAGAGDSLRGDLDDDLASSGKGVSATEKSINKLLASLGVDDDDDDDGTSWKFNDDDDDDDDKKKEEDAGGSGDIDDEKVASIMDELQVWRGRNASSLYEAWDAKYPTIGWASPCASLRRRCSPWTCLGTSSTSPPTAGRRSWGGRGRTGCSYSAPGPWSAWRRTCRRTAPCSRYSA
jgi:hypothetical protein